MSEKSSPSGLDQMIKVLQVIAILGSGTGVLCIMLGWVVSHTNFSQCHIYSANLTHAGYARVGALALATVLFLFLILLAIKQTASYFWTGFKHLVNTYCFSLETGEPVRGIPGWCLWPGRLLLLLLILLVSSILISAGLSISSIELPDRWKMFLATATAANLGIVLLLYYLISVKRHLLSRLADISLLVALSVGLLFLHAFTFAQTLYKDIPAYYEGGNPAPVTLVFKDNEETNRFLDKEREDFHSVSDHTESAQLIAELDQGYTFLVRDSFDQEKAIIVQREMVQEIRFIDNSLTLGR